MKLIVIAFLVFLGTNCISFYAQEGKEKCFSDEIPSKTVVIIYYELKSETPKDDKEPQQQQAMPTANKDNNIELRVYGPDQMLLESFKAKGNKQSILTGLAGRYKFCVFKPKSFWKMNEYKFSLKIQQGVDYNLQDAANKTHVENLASRIDGLTNRTRDFISLQQLNREQEDKLTSKSIEINQRVIQTTVVQIVVLIVSGIYQIWSLRRFFKSRFLL